MDDFFKPEDYMGEENADDVVEDSSKRRIPVQMTVVEALEVADNFKQKLIDETYDVMIDEGEAEVKVPLEVVDAIDVLVHYVNTSFEIDDEL
jgi:hypothetical protein